jgi:beta-mannosidase
VDVEVTLENHQAPKRSYAYVKRAYQPLLVSMQFDRRRWHNDEVFQGRLWVVNDTYGNYYRFFPQMHTEGEGAWQNPRQVPRAGGYNGEVEP